MMELEKGGGREDGKVGGVNCASRRKLTYKDLSYGATGCKPKNVLPDCRIFRHELQSRRKLTSVARHVHAQPVANASSCEPGTHQEIDASDQRAHQVVGTHHLRATIRAKLGKNVILGAVRQAIEQEVYPEQKHPPRNLGVFSPAALLALLPRMQRKDSHTSRHGCDN